MLALSNRKRLLIFDLGAVFGGVEIYLENLTRAISPYADCVVVCSNPEFQRRLKQANMPFVALPNGGGFKKLARMLLAVWMLPYLVVRHRIDTVQINGYGEIVLLPLARMMGRTAVASRHLSFAIEVDHWWQAPSRFLARFLYRRLARFADRIVCVSAEVGQEVCEIVPAEKVVVIPNWVSSIPPLRTRNRPADGVLNVLFVGRLVEYKGLQVLIDAVRKLSEGDNPVHLRVTVVGEGPYRSTLEKRAEGLDVHFAGFQLQVKPFYEEADIFVNPSLGPEGSPLVALEAMAQSLPCILSTLPVHFEVARKGQTAMFCELDNADHLAQCLRTMAEDDQLRQRYAEAGYRRVKLHHNPESAAEAYLRAFEIVNHTGELASVDA